MAGPSLSLLDLITEALSLLGVYAPGEPIEAEDSAACLFTAQALIDGWSAEPLTITSTAIYSFATTPGQASYTLGPSSVSPACNWIVPVLPPAISSYGALVGTTVEFGLAPLTEAQWAAIGLKQLGSNIPLAIWPQYGAASHTLWAWPVPAAAGPVILYCPLAVPNFVTIQDSVALRPGYQEAFTFELALKTAPKFGSVAVIPDWLPQAWQDAKGRIKAANFPIIDAQCDPALTVGGRRGGGSIDFYLGK